MSLDMSNWESKFEVTGNERLKIIFVHIFVKCESIYVKPRPKWSSAHSTYIAKCNFTSGNALFCDICVCLSHKFRWLRSGTSYFMERLPLHLWFWDQKVKGQGHWEQNVTSSLVHIVWIGECSKHDTHLLQETRGTVSTLEGQRSRQGDWKENVKKHDSQTEYPTVGHNAALGSRKGNFMKSWTYLSK